MSQDASLHPADALPLCNCVVVQLQTLSYCAGRSAFSNQRRLWLQGSRFPHGSRDSSRALLSSSKTISSQQWHKRFTTPSDSALRQIQLVASPTGTTRLRQWLSLTTSLTQRQQCLHALFRHSMSVAPNWETWATSFKLGKFLHSSPALLNLLVYLPYKL